MKNTVTSSKIKESLGLNIVWNIYDGVSTQSNKINNNKGLIVFWHFNTEILIVTFWCFSCRRSERRGDRRAAGAAERRHVLSGDAAADRTPSSGGSQWDPGGTDQHRSQPVRRRSGLGRSRPLLGPGQERPGQEEEVGSCLKSAGTC